MKKTAEIDREPITVDDVEYQVTEIIWKNGGRSFDVYKGDKLLTEDESLDEYPTAEQIRDLVLNKDNPDNSLGALAAIEWTKERAEVEVAALDSRARSLLMDALRAKHDEEADAGLLTGIREKLAETENGSDAVAVVFDVFDYDNGWFFNGSDAEVFYSDGSMDFVDFPVDDALTEAYGRVHEHARLGVNLRTGKFEFEEDGWPDAVYDSLGVKREEEAQQPG